MKTSLSIKRNKGFTLIEVVASLVILVLSLTMLLSLVNQNLKAVIAVKEEISKIMIGQNEMTNIYLKSVLKNYDPPNLNEYFLDRYETELNEPDLCLPIETGVDFFKYSVNVYKKDEEKPEEFSICLFGDIRE